MKNLNKRSASDISSEAKSQSQKRHSSIIDESSYKRQKLDVSDQIFIKFGQNSELEQSVSDDSSSQSFSDEISLNIEDQHSKDNIIKRQRKRRSPQIYKPTDDMLKQLPAAVLYLPNLNMGTKANVDAYKEDADWVQIGDFKIDIDNVTKPQLIQLRRYLPQAEYRLLKNRKSARLCRQKVKQERSEMFNRATEFDSITKQLEQQVTNEQNKVKEFLIGNKQKQEQIQQLKKMVFEFQAMQQSYKNCQEKKGQPTEYDGDQPIIQFVNELAEDGKDCGSKLAQMQNFLSDSAKCIHNNSSKFLAQRMSMMFWAQGLQNSIQGLDSANNQLMSQNFKHQNLSPLYVQDHKFLNDQMSPNFFNQSDLMISQINKSQADTTKAPIMNQTIQSCKNYIINNPKIQQTEFAQRYADQSEVLVKTKAQPTSQSNTMNTEIQLATPLQNHNNSLWINSDHQQTFADHLYHLHSYSIQNVNMNGLMNSVKQVEIFQNSSTYRDETASQVGGDIATPHIVQPTTTQE